MIFGHLDIRTIHNCSMVCKRWKIIANQEEAQPKNINFHSYQNMRSASVANQILKQRSSRTEKINFGRIKFSDDFPLISFFELLPKEKIRKIDLSAIGTKKYVNDECVKEIANHFPNLTSLNLFGCWMITDASLLELGKNCTKLKKLNIGSCYKITDNGIFSISCCKYLEKLNLWRCKQLTDKCLEKLGNECKRIKILTISDCEYLTNNGIEVFQSNCKIYF